MSELDDIRDQVKTHDIVIAGKKETLDYTIASFAYLSEKYPNFAELFGNASTKGKDKSVLFKPEFLSAITDIVYAGLIKPGENGEDTSGWSAAKVKGAIHLKELKSIAETATQALVDALPEVEENPTVVPRRRGKR